MAALQGAFWAGEWGRWSHSWASSRDQAFVAAVIGGFGQPAGGGPGGYILGFTEIFLVGLCRKDIRLRDAMVFVNLDHLCCWCGRAASFRLQEREKI